MRKTTELDQIAKDLALGKIFSDWQIQNDDDVWKVFQIINMMSDEQRATLARQDIGMLYEYKTAATAWDSGIPMFSTMNILNTKEAEYVRKKFIAYHKRLGEPESGGRVVDIPLGAVYDSDGTDTPTV